MRIQQLCNRPDISPAFGVDLFHRAVRVCISRERHLVAGVVLEDIFRTVESVITKQLQNPVNHSPRENTILLKCKEVLALVVRLLRQHSQQRKVKQAMALVSTGFLALA